MRQRTHGVLVAVLTLASSLLVALPVDAQEVALTVGRLLGDDLADGDVGPGDFLPTDFSDGTLYGVRVGTGFVFFELEAALLTGKSELLEGTSFATDARFTYLEASAVMRIFPGPVSPFVAGGLGLHRLSLDGVGDLDHTTLGYNVGAGVKVSLGKLGVRADLRDHITPLDLADLSPALADALGLDAGTTLHDFEVSLGLILSF